MALSVVLLGVEEEERGQSIEMLPHTGKTAGNGRAGSQQGRLLSEMHSFFPDKNLKFTERNK